MGRTDSDINADLKQETLLQISNDLKQTLKNTENLKDKVDTIPRQLLELAEFTVPRLVIVLPEDSAQYNPANWFHLNYRLYFLCECENDNERHFAFHNGYDIKQPRKFLRKYGPYLRKMLPVVKHVLSVGSIVIPQLTHITTGISDIAIPQDPIFWETLNIQIEHLDEILTKAGVSVNISTDEKIQFVEGAELRGIQHFLKKADAHCTYGNLFRSLTNDGHVRWVCMRHCEGHYVDTKLQDLQKQFQILGGEIKDNVAIIQGQASNKFSEILSVLRQGLPIFSIILKDLKLTGDMFNELLTFVSQQPMIGKLELENITVSNLVFKMQKRDIISKLEDAMKKNSKLTIQYSFTRPLNKFASILRDTVDIILLTNSRLVFRVRSQEDIPSLELAGSNETGFSVSINNSGDKDEISHKIAITNVFSMLPNITKICLHNGVISKSSWTCFYQFLTTKKTLQELTIHCLLTLEQTEDLSQILRSNTTLKTLHLFYVWARTDELRGCEEIIKILYTNTALTELTLACCTDRLKVGFIARYLLQNKSLRILRLPKCRIYQNTDIELFEDFLKNTSIHTLSLEPTSTNCATVLERLITIQKQKESSPTQNSIQPYQYKSGQTLALSNCRDDEHRRRSNKTIIRRKYTSFEPYLEMRNIALSTKLNFNVTRLKIGKQVLAENDIQMLVKGLHDKSTVTHLNWNGIKISFACIRQIFDILSNDRILRVIDISRCICYSDRPLFTQGLQSLNLTNSSLEIIYENPLI